MKEAYEQAAIAMCGYMTELDTVEIDDNLEPCYGQLQCPTLLLLFTVSFSHLILMSFLAEDLESLLYDFLEEILFLFTTEFIIFKEIEITHFDADNFALEFEAYLILLFLHSIFDHHDDIDIP